MSKGNSHDIRIQKIKNGDSDSFKELFFELAKPLIYFSNRIVKDYDEAENIVQDVFVSIWQNREKLDPSLKIKTYLYVAVKNRSLKFIRHENVKQDSFESLQEIYQNPSDPDPETSYNELKSAIDSAIKSLPEKCRLIFEMNRFDKLSYKEIAKVLDISVKTVETQMGRALKSLRQQLAKFISLILFFWSC
ncbi:MAG: RNA polymerase sigma-70 factor [Ignavibacteria bacterium]|jgi:RNA polymerase sigma-70 factor (ECF subfamily)